MPGRSIKIFTTWLPDIFVDNHTSNGADYQYTMTLIATQHNKLEAPLGAIFTGKHHACPNSTPT
jgi:hypothetical protein